MPIASRAPVAWETDATQQAFKQYIQTFIGGHSKPYALQPLAGEWRTIYRQVSDPLIKKHLEQQHWVGVKASWYPFNFILDLDKPKPDTLEQIVARLQLAPSQYLLMTSPSYTRTGNLHLALRLEYNERSPTLKLGYRALQHLVGDLCEVYPQSRRKFRLPFGHDQFILTSEERRLLKDLSWQDSFYWLKKLDPVALENLLPSSALLTPARAVEAPVAPGTHATATQAAELLEHGLQQPNSRHLTQWAIALLLYRRNYLATDAASTLRRWIRTKHNDYSDAVRLGQWRVIDAEIDRQVKWIWEHYEPLPDVPHNLQGFVTQSDLTWLAEVFHGDVVNQKRLFNLLCYYRPRAHHDYVFIPQRIWRAEVANDRTYQEFLYLLEAKGWLRSIKTYRHIPIAPALSFSRKFKLTLPSPAGPALQQDGRNCQEYYAAWLSLGHSPRVLAELTGVARQRFYDARVRLATSSACPEIRHIN